MTDPIHQQVNSPSDGGGTRRSDPLLEAAIVYGIVVGATYLLTRFRNEYVQLLIGVFYLLLAFRLAQRELNGLRRFGIDLAGVLSPPEGEPPQGLLARTVSSAVELGRSIRGALTPACRELGAALLVLLVVFPPYMLGFWWWTEPARAFHLFFGKDEDWFSFVASQLVVTGLPEEVLFRGYFQTRLTDEWPRQIRLLGARLSPRAWIVQAALFGAIHALVDHNPARLATFFPGLLFGWVRAWRGGIGAAIVVHASCNVLEWILEHGWL